MLESISSARTTQGPDFAPALEAFLLDLLHVVGAFGLGDGEQLGDVLWASITEPHGPRITGQAELDLELAPVPAGLCGIVVRMDHASAFMRTATSGQDLI